MRIFKNYLAKNYNYVYATATSYLFSYIYMVELISIKLE